MWLLIVTRIEPELIFSSFEVTATKPIRHYRLFCWIFKRESLYLPLRHFGFNKITVYVVTALFISVCILRYWNTDANIRAFELKTIFYSKKFRIFELFRIHINNNHNERAYIEKGP